VTAAAPPHAGTVSGADPCALLTDTEVGELLRVPPRTVVRLRQRGMLPGVAVGQKYVRTRRRDVECFLDALPVALYSGKYANQTHARLSASPDGRGDAAPPAPPARLDTSRSRRGAGRDK
jgi:excisionase family DNA binding protein